LFPNSNTLLGLKLDVKMESPQVLIPTRMKDFIIADFGNLVINNHFITQNGDEINNYSLIMSDMRISRYLFAPFCVALR
jgi:hypothetical protein